VCSFFWASDGGRLAASGEALIIQQVGAFGSGLGFKAAVLDLGDLWQLLFGGGLVFWLFLCSGALRPAMKSAKRVMPSLFLYASSRYPLFYLPALFYPPHQLAIIDNWRFWIIICGSRVLRAFRDGCWCRHVRPDGARQHQRLPRAWSIWTRFSTLLGGIVGTGHHWYSPVKAR